MLQILHLELLLSGGPCPNFLELLSFSVAFSSAFFPCTLISSSCVLPSSTALPRRHHDHEDCISDYLDLVHIRHCCYSPHWSISLPSLGSEGLHPRCSTRIGEEQEVHGPRIPSSCAIYQGKKETPIPDGPPLHGTTPIHRRRRGRGRRKRPQSAPVTELGDGFNGAATGEKEYTG
uniref:Uncharacterized protein n=1 Tax=Arundo donax TaxID=35708 RepID=A0A0A9BCI7_ARUDO